MKAIIAMALLLVLVACVPKPMVWHKSGLDAETFNKEHAQCVMYARGIGAAGSGSLGNPMSAGVGASFGHGAVEGFAKAMAQRDAYKECMQLYGYTLEQ